MIRATVALALLLPACSVPQDDIVVPQQASAMRLLADTSAGDYARVVQSREFQFPADHGSHKQYRSEWWYFTGNLRTRQGRHFGFELTFFRYGLDPQTPERESKWGTNQAWMAHLAVTDTEGNEFVAQERFSREALGLSGSQSEPFRIWLEDWSATGESAAILPLELRAGTDRAGFRLTLSGTKRPVSHGDGGVDRKGPEYGNASHYYSLTRLEATGTMRIDETEFAVTGTAWMDREWGTSSLSPDVAGWDWFGLQLADDRELMYYRLRTEDGESTPFSGGSLVQPDGTRVKLSVDDVSLTPLEYWTSPASGTRYPVGWRLSLPREDMTLLVRSYLPQQELDLTVRYWEGAVNITGTQAGQELSGVGYAELSGY